MSDSAPRISIEEHPQAGDLCLFRLGGDLDARCGVVFDQALSSPAIANKNFAVVEMSGVTLIGSIAMGKLLGLRRRFIERGGDAVLSSMSLEIKMKCLVMGMNKIFKIYNDLNSALSAYAWEVGHEPEDVELSFPPQTGIVPSVRRFVSGILSQKGYCSRDCFRVETIVDELCNNAIEYGSKALGDTITIRLSIDWDKIELRAENVSDPENRDLLKSFMNDISCEVPHDGDVKRGRGLAVVKMLASDFSADVTDTGTIVHVTKMKEASCHGITNRACL